jgi:hypothetical protein
MECKLAGGYSQAKDSSYLILSEADDNLLADYKSRESASCCEPFHFSEDFVLVLFGEQVNVREFKLDAALAQKSLAGFAVTARTQCVELT